MSKERAYELIAKSISMDLSAAEQSELKDCLQLYPALQEEQIALQKTWNMTEDKMDWEPNTDLALEKLQSRIAEDKVVKLKPRKRFSSLYRIAAVGIILIGLGFILKNSLSAPGQPLEYAATQDSIEAIQMTDGSTILLNQAANITFFPGEKSMRKVALEGQAFFDVFRDVEKPFIISTKKADIEVLGTSFDVDANATSTQVTVLTGVVRVTDKANGAAVVLTAGESISVGTSSALTKSEQQVPFSNYKALLQFDDLPLEEVFQRLGWTFNKKIAWDAKALKNCTLTSNLTDKNLEEVLTILKHALNLDNTQVLNDQVILTGGNCK